MLSKATSNSTDTGTRYSGNSFARNTLPGGSKNPTVTKPSGDDASKKIHPQNSGKSAPTGPANPGGQKDSKVQPTVSEFLDASASEYAQSKTAGDLVPFKDNDKQLADLNIGDGIYGSAWSNPKGQVIVSFEGTSGATPSGFSQPLLSAQQREDQDISAGKVTAGETEAVAFTKAVIASAAKQGISSDNVYVTGHSLGAIQAEYVAQQTGLGGMAFEPTGLPNAPNAVGKGNNFVDVLTYGDPVAADATDVPAEKSILTQFPPNGLPHYGKLLFTGDKSWDAQLTAGAQVESQAIADHKETPEQAIGNLLASRSTYHVLATQAHDLGVTVPAPLNGSIGNGLSGPVDNVGDKTLGDVLGSLP